MACETCLSIVMTALEFHNTPLPTQLGEGQLESAAMERSLLLGVIEAARDTQLQVITDLPNRPSEEIVSSSLCHHFLATDSIEIEQSPLMRWSMSLLNVTLLLREFAANPTLDVAFIHTLLQRISTSQPDLLQRFSRLSTSLSQVDRFLRPTVGLAQHALWTVMKRQIGYSEEVGRVLTTMYEHLKSA